MENFTPFSALIGGALIGLSASLLLILKGRIAGISGIVNGVLLPQTGDLGWRILFIVGLALGGLIYQLAIGDVSHIQTSASTLTLVIAGLLIGVGSTLGSGCTSGHGVCGIARLSPRSIVATLVFMSTAILTVALF